MTATKRPPWLMDPEHPVVIPRNDRSFSSVQKWVMSTLVVFTAVHMGLGAVLAAWFIDPDQTVARIGLTVIGCAFCALGLACGFLIHGHRPVNAWLLLSVIPAAALFFML